MKITSTCSLFFLMILILAICCFVSLSQSAAIYGEQGNFTGHCHAISPKIPGSQYYFTHPFIVRDKIYCFLFLRCDNVYVFHRWPPPVKKGSMECACLSAERMHARIKKHSKFAEPLIPGGSKLKQVLFKGKETPNTFKRIYGICCFCV